MVHGLKLHHLILG